VRAIISGVSGNPVESTDIVFRDRCGTSEDRCSRFDALGPSYFAATELELWVGVGTQSPGPLTCWYYDSIDNWNWVRIPPEGTCEQYVVTGEL
jgi:hypothetical protein